MKTYFILKRIQRKDLGTKTRLGTIRPLTFRNDGLPLYGPSTMLPKPSANIKAVPTS